VGYVSEAEKAPEQNVALTGSGAGTIFSTSFPVSQFKTFFYESVSFLINCISSRMPTIDNLSISFWWLFKVSKIVGGYALMYIVRS